LTGKGGRLSDRLDDLEQAGFIMSYRPYGYKKRGVYYRISDQYCYFYLKWIAPIKDRLKHESSINYWRQKINTPAYHTWMGYAFETICYNHIPQIKQKLSIDPDALASPWRYFPEKGNDEHGAQIDLLFNGMTTIYVCEIKCTVKAFSIDKEYAKNLLKKISALESQSKTAKQIFLVMITSNGLKQTMYSEEIVDGEVTSDDLFRDLE